MYIMLKSFHFTLGSGDVRDLTNFQIRFLIESIKLDNAYQSGDLDPSTSLESLEEKVEGVRAEDVILEDARRRAREFVEGG